MRKEPRTNRGLAHRAEPFFSCLVHKEGDTARSSLAWNVGRDWPKRAS